jgi:hypothetical protein
MTMPAAQRAEHEHDEPRSVLDTMNCVPSTPDAQPTSDCLPPRRARLPTAVCAMPATVPIAIPALGCPEREVDHRDDHQVDDRRFPMAAQATVVCSASATPSMARMRRVCI